MSCSCRSLGLASNFGADERQLQDVRGVVVNPPKLRSGLDHLSDQCLGAASKKHLITTSYGESRRMGVEL